MDNTAHEPRPGIKLSPPVLLLAFIWWYFFLEQEQQRIFLFLVAFVKFAEYFYFLPGDLEQYQEEDWWDVPTIKKALLTMSIFWSLAWLSSKLPSTDYLPAKRQRRTDELVDD